MVTLATNQNLVGRIARLSPAQRALLEQRLLTSRKVQPPQTDRIPKAAAPGDFPLTHVQRRVWAFEQLYPRSAVYNLIWVKSLHGAIDRTAFEQAFESLVARHPMLRATFASKAGGPVQRISPASNAASVHQLAVEVDAADPQGRAREIALEDAAKPFDLERGPLARASLIRISDHEHWLLLVFHHLVSDGWSMEVAERDLAEFYNASLAGGEPNLPPLPVEYADYAVWQQAARRGDSKADYWVAELSGAPAELGLQADFARPAQPDPAAWIAEVPVPGSLLAALERAAGDCDATLYTLLIAAWALVLHRHGCGEEIMIGTPLAGRTRPELSQLVGFFANTLPLRVSLQGDPAFGELAGRVKQKVVAAVEHQDAAFDEAVARSKAPRSPGVTPGFQTAVAYLESQRSQPRFDGLRAEHLLLDTRAAHFETMVFGHQFSGQLKLSVALRKQLFSEATCQAMANHLARLLEAIAADPKQPISRYGLLAASERAAVLALGTGAGRPCPPEGVHELFERQAAETPDRVALVTRDHAISYSQLSRESNSIAAAAAGKGSIVAVLCDGSATMVAAFLGVMKAGAAYLPLDASDPPDRLALLLREAGVKLVLTATGSERFPGVHTLPLTNLGGVQNAPPAKVTPESPACVMYTSGSTGVPKAVVVPHRGIVRLVKGSGFARLDADRVFLHMAPPAFDASTFEIWAPLLNGGCCVLYSGRRAALHEIGAAIQRHRVTTMWLTSSLFNAVIDEAPEILAPVGQLLTGGEALSVRHVTRALQLLPATEIINGYGPTECTTFACTYPIPRDLALSSRSVPIGTPIGNTNAYILDERGELAPAGVPGELYLGGDGVALGYLNQPELTRAAFVPDPFRPGGQLMYRTGDRARWLPQGQIEFLGRADGQVKIRGFRIEPGEIEAALQSLPGVLQAAIAVQSDSSGVKQLNAYVLPVREQASGVTAESVRSALAGRLPSYMIPSRVMIVDGLPIGENGKVDRALLPAFEPAASTAAEPRDDLESGLRELWRELLNAPQAGIADDFFLHGGDSLRAIRLAARIEKRFQRAVPVATILAAPTVEKLAVILRELEGDPGYVVVTPGESEPVIVWLDPAVPLRHLAAGLGPDQPLHSVTLSPAELAALPEPRRLEDMAAVLADKLERRRPGGPTILASFCLRTFLAVETARILRDRGHAVPLVVLADPSDPETTDHLLHPASRAALASRASAHLRRLRSLPFNEWGSYVAGRAMALIRRFRIHFGRNLILERPILIAGARHRFKPYDGALLLVRIVAEGELAQDEIVRSWSRIAAGPLLVRRLGGGHVDLFDPPHVAEFARLLREAIAALLTQTDSSGSQALPDYDQS